MVTSVARHAPASRLTAMAAISEIVMGGMVPRRSAGRPTTGDRMPSIAARNVPAITRAPASRAARRSEAGLPASTGVRGANSGAVAGSAPRKISHRPIQVHRHIEEMHVLDAPAAYLLRPSPAATASGRRLGLLHIGTGQRPEKALFGHLRPVLRLLYRKYAALHQSGICVPVLKWQRQVQPRARPPAGRLGRWTLMRRYSSGTGKGQPRASRHWASSASGPRCLAGLMLTVRRSRFAEHPAGHGVKRTLPDSSRDTMRAKVGPGTSRNTLGCIQHPRQVPGNGLPT